MKASGKTTSFAPRRAASAVRSPTFASVAFVSKTTGELCTTAATKGLDIVDNHEQYRRKGHENPVAALDHVRRARDRPRADKRSGGHSHGNTSRRTHRDWRRNDRLGDRIP